MDKGLEQCDKCDYFISVEEAYKQGRADAIEKIKTYLRLHRKYAEYQSNDFVFYHPMYEWLEEVKEQK